MTQSSTAAGEDSFIKYKEIAKRAIFHYPGNDQATVELLDYSENYTYLVTNNENRKKKILRVCRPNYHCKLQIESELKWIQAVDEQVPVEVPIPIEGKNGKLIQTINMENDPFEYYCVMFTFLEGEAPDEKKEEELMIQFERLGEITARLHNHTQHWKEAATLHRESWDFDAILGDHPKWARWQDGIGITPEIKELFQNVSNIVKHRLERFGKGPDRFGLIHADLRLANLLIEGKSIKVIDFDDCGFGWYLFDLGAALSFIEHKPYVPHLVRAWVKGYRKWRALSKEEVNEIPTFIMMRRLMLISWIGSRNNNTTKELGEEYTKQTIPLANKYVKDFKE
ncbi:phosphotransferase enzyme family protein [Alteribacillus iranensis]|uniref:Ser/Thr protein kinase RdoA involved in Cpx stress response, MazF antagonist n=1 Tax=Alteribacillus iranensis TaxID=930128 RepID=A0A1I2B280_9BACI|nr:phosphotransferase [Alteribacillus iranensis]SFE50274.1 Ser/Thr protein kinase RdoA involved in Cpx stress response, MazF antagonist [Alteribacillus iranensis]